MNSNFKDAVSKALRFAVTPKRWLPFFILDIAFFSMIVALILSNIGNITNLVTAIQTATTQPMAILNMIGLFSGILALIVVYSLLKLWVTGAVLWQSYKENEYGKSFSVAYHRYLHILVAVILIGIISGVAGMIPYIGSILSIIVAIAFFFILPGIIVGNYGGVETLRRSWGIFMKWTLNVYLICLVVSILSGIITIIFMIPMLAVFLGTFLPYLIQMVSSGIATGGIQMFSVMTTAMLNNIVTFVISGIIFLIGSSIASAFAAKANVEFFLRIKK